MKFREQTAKKKSIRQIAGMFLAVTVLLAGSPYIAEAAEIVKDMDGTAYAQDAAGFVYQIPKGATTKKGCSIYMYTGEKSTVTFPAKCNSYVVTNIGTNLGQLILTNLQTVKIPSGYTTIETQAFQNQTDLYQIEIPAVLLIQLPQYLCRNSRHDAVIRHITGYDCPCRHNTVLSDGHSATDRCTRTNPASASDMDGLCILQVMKTIRILLRQPLIGKKRMTRGCNRHVCAYPHTILQRNRRTVQKCTFIVDKTAFSKMDIDTIFTVKWGKNGCSSFA